MTRDEALQKARDARSAKALERKLNPVDTSTLPTTLDAFKEASNQSRQEFMWREAMVAQMHSGRCIGVTQLSAASTFADEYVKLALSKFA